MQEFVQQGWDRVLARLVGPMHVRLLLQPLIAILLGIRDGVRDARAGAPPYLLALITEKEQRRERIASLWKSLRVGLPLAILLDAVVQYLLFRSIRIAGAIFVGTLLMALPYCLARGFTNRIVSAKGRSRLAVTAHSSQSKTLLP
jgi:hypothetical protein